MQFLIVNIANKKISIFSVFSILGFSGTWLITYFKIVNICLLYKRSMYSEDCFVKDEAYLVSQLFEFLNLDCNFKFLFTPPFF